MLKLSRLGAAFATTLVASPAFAQVAAPDPAFSVVPLAQRLTLLRIFANASWPVKLVLWSLVAAILAAAVTWILQLAKLGQRRSDGVAGAVAFLSALSAAGLRIGLFGAAWCMLNSFIGMANVRPSPSLGVLAPGFAEATLAICLGLAASAIAAIAHRHLKARLYSVDLPDAIAA